MAMKKAVRSAKGRVSTGQVGVRDRACEAHLLRVGGMSWHDVAAKVGYLDGRVGCPSRLNRFARSVRVATDMRADASIGECSLSTGLACAAT